MKILIVDDEPDLLNILKKYFIKMAYTVVTATNGQEAWQLLTATANVEEVPFVPIDVILTDHRMPIMNGVELVIKMRQAGYEIPVVMMTGDGEARQDQYIQTQLVALISKPMRLATLNEIFAGFAPKVEKAQAEKVRPPLTEEPPSKAVDAAIPLPTKSVEAVVRILVVDDEPEICEVISKILTKAAYEVDRASDGMVALAKWSEEANTGRPYDLLIIDLKMPRMNGQMLLTEIRQIAPLLPIIVLTGHGDLATAYELLAEYHIADFYNKPIGSVQSLLFSVKNAIEKAQLHQKLMQLNQQYMALNTALEARVEQRTSELKIETERAKVANQAKSDLLSRMSHELHTPLNAILGFTQLQEIHLDSGEYQKMKGNLPSILFAGRHLLRLIDDILDIERCQHGELAISLKHCDLDSVIGQCIEFVTPEIEHTKLALHWDKTGLAVLADDLRLKQILVNLLSNAIKFNQVGGTITVNIQVGTDQVIEVCVSDTGVGIAANELSQLFEPFTRLKYADTKEIDGIGNGLAISQLLALQMNGDIKVKSVVGQGSQFTLRLTKSDNNTAESTA